MDYFKPKTESKPAEKKQKRGEMTLVEYVDSGHYPIKGKAKCLLEKSPVVGPLLAERKEKKEDERLRAFTATFNERVTSPVPRRPSTRQKAKTFSRRAWSQTKEKASAFKFYMMTGSRPGLW